MSFLSLLHDLQWRIHVGLAYTYRPNAPNLARNFVKIIPQNTFIMAIFNCKHPVHSHC